MEEWGTSLSASAFEDSWKPALSRGLRGLFRRPYNVFLEHLGASLCSASDVFSLHVSKTKNKLKDVKNSSASIKRLCKLFSPEHLKGLIFEAIEQCEVKDVKVVRLSEEFFTSIWPIMVSAVVLLSFVYLYFKGYIDRGGSKARSSGSLDFRDIYISIILFHAAYVWIKFRDVIPKGAIYRRPGSNKFEVRIKFPVMRGEDAESKRIPLGLYDTSTEAEVAYLIAAFYCKKRKHTGRLDLGGGASFPIPTLSLDPNLPYEEKRELVRNQVLRVYAEFEVQKASRNVPPHVLGQALETSTGEGHLLGTSAIQQLRQPLNSGMDSTMQGQGSQLGSNIHNGVNFNNPSSVSLFLHVETQRKLLDAYEQIEFLKAQASRTEVESMRLEIKCSELERENVRLKHQFMQLQAQLHQELEFDTNRFLSNVHE